MDHSYCVPSWALTEDGSQVRLSDLLTDHTYALRPGSVWTEPFDSVHDWYIDNTSPTPLSAEVGPSEITDRDHHSDAYAMLNYLFSRIEIHIRPGSELKLLQDSGDLSSFPSLKSDGSVLYGSPSDVLQLLLAIESAWNNQRSTSSTGSQVNPISDTECPVSPLLVNSADASQSEETPPIYVTIIKKDRKFANRKRKVAPGSKSHRIHRRCRQTHTQSKQHICPECHISFTRRFALKEHLRMIHERNPPYRCQHCDRGFKRPALLRDHIYSRHAHVSRFICPVCQKGFIRRPDCLRHQAQQHALPS